MAPSLPARPGQRARASPGSAVSRARAVPKSSARTASKKPSLASSMVFSTRTAWSIAWPETAPGVDAWAQLGYLGAVRAVVQRVLRAEVRAGGEVTGKIGPGLVALVGVKQGDTPAAARYVAEKIAHLRIFDDEVGRMERSLLDAGGEALVVSQFTLFGD